MNTFIITFIVVFALFALLFVLALASGGQNKENDEQYKKRIDSIAERIKANRESIPEFKVSVKSGDEDGCFFCKVAGVKYHCDESDVGGFLGYVAPDPTNEHDRNACAVYRNDEKLLGYIPKDELTDYRDWSDLKPCPCVGFIKQGDDTIFGKVKVIDNIDDDHTAYIVIKFVRWMIANLGLKYIPVGFTVEGEKPKTKKLWLEYLDKEIAERENDLFEN